MAEKCTDIRLGALLHSYELGLLSAEDRERFEVHLLDCEHCFAELQAFEAETALLLGDSEIRSTVAESLRDRAEVILFREKCKRYLWPRAPLVLRPAFLGTLVVLLAIPALLYLTGTDRAAIEEVTQTGYLLPTRGTELPVFNRGLGDEVNLTFRFDDAVAGKEYRVTVIYQDSSIVYDNPNFHSFDEYKVGALSIHLPDMESGDYRLQIRDPAKDSIQVLQEYRFRID